MGQVTPPVGPHNGGVANPDARELGLFLRSRRAARTPQAAGLRGGGTRRTAGLRREELATLSGVSIEYLVRLEQGRHPEPSGQVLSALADCLGLDRAQRRHLFALAGRSDPGPSLAVRTDVPPALLRLLVQVEPDAAWVLNRRRDILAWNRGGSALFNGLEGLPIAQRNQVRLLFGSPAGTDTGWSDVDLVQRDTVAQLRSAFTDAAFDPATAALVDEVAQLSPDFRALWEERQVARSCSLRRSWRHPAAGVVRFGTELLDLDGGDLQLVLMQPDELDADRWTVFVDGWSRRTIRAVR